MKKLTLIFEFNEIKNVIQSGGFKTNNYSVVVEFLNGGRVILGGKKALRSYKQLCRQFPGEHLD
jgi:hypothetical protein